MRFFHTKTKVKSASNATITFNNPITVRIFNDRNFEKYKNGQRCEFIGGEASNSPFKIFIEKPGNYHFVIEPGNFTQEQVGVKIELEPIEKPKRISKTNVEEDSEDEAFEEELEESEE